MLISSDIVLKGKRIILRQFVEADRSAYKAMLSDAKTMEFLLYMIHSEKGGWKDSDLDERLKNQQDRNENNTGFGTIIADSRSDSFLGSIGVNQLNKEHKWCEIGMILHHPNWGNGTSREARFLLIDLCFEKLGINRIGAHTYVTNVKSRKNLEYFGFKLEGIEREKFLEQGKFIDDASYALLKKDWEKIKEKISGEVF